MTVRQVRSQNASLQEGATDGKYRKRRPDTEIADSLGDAHVRRNRASLNPTFNYDYINQEATDKVNPGKN